MAIVENRESLSSDENCSFQKSKRLLKGPQFKTVLNGGVKVVCPDIVVYAIPREENARLGLIVSKKVGNAVVRNQVKRRLREVFRLYSHITKCDLVVIARYTASNSDYRQLERSFGRCIQRLQKKFDSKRVF